MRESDGLIIIVEIRFQTLFIFYHIVVLVIVCSIVLAARPWLHCVVMPVGHGIAVAVDLHVLFVYISFERLRLFLR